MHFLSFDLHHLNEDISTKSWTSACGRVRALPLGEEFAKREIIYRGKWGYDVRHGQRTRQRRHVHV